MLLQRYFTAASLLHKGVAALPDSTNLLRLSAV